MRSIGGGGGGVGRGSIRSIGTVGVGGGVEVGGGGGGGLAGHSAVVIEKKGKLGATSVSLMCFGGYVDRERRKHPDYLVRFDVAK